jgi:Flp pilus assembly protein TadG
LHHYRRGGVAELTALLAPRLLIAVAFSIDVTGWYRDSLRLQTLADRVALTAGPAFAAGNRGAAFEIAQAVVNNDDVAARIDAAGVPRSRRWQGQARAFEIIVSSEAHYLVAGLTIWRAIDPVVGPRGGFAGPARRVNPTPPALSPAPGRPTR